MFTRIDAVEPPLPGVTIQVRAGVADQLLLVNTTTTPVEVLDRTGRAFLRITDKTVEANYASVDWYTSNSPLGLAQPPPQTRHDDWRPVSRTNSWGWFDHRLHDRARPLTAELKAATTTVRLADWTVPLRYGTQAATIKGHVEYRPVLGAFRTTTKHTPKDVTADVLDGRVPGLFVTWRGSGTLTVKGIDGEDFARLSPQGAEVNEASETYREDQRLRGRTPTGTADPHTPRWRRESTTPRLTWLDRRLSYAPGLPPDDVAHARTPTVLVEWSVPVSSGGTDDTISGTTTWHPATAPDPGSSRAWLLATAGIAAATLATVIYLRRRVTQR